MHKYKYIIILIVVLIFAAIGWQIYKLTFSEKPEALYEWRNWLNLGEQKACTTEAKFCPDGSYVGRTGPNCEFAQCPSKALCEGGTCPGQTEETCENLCGDGICQEVVCLAIGCPCAESKESCPIDCINSND